MPRPLGWLALTVAALAVAVAGIVHVGGPLGALVALLMAGFAALGAHLAGRRPSGPGCDRNDLPDA